MSQIFPSEKLITVLVIFEAENALSKLALSVTEVVPWVAGDENLLNDWRLVFI
jgi:hypothetical protein